MKIVHNDRVLVLIFGREYERDPGGLTPLEVQSLAEFVDEKMRDISERFAVVDTQKIAVLAAINISLDYLQLKENMGKNTESLNPRLEKLHQILDDALQV